MRFLLDENFPKAAESLLLESGHTVIDIRGTDLQGTNDFELFELAQENKAVLLTTDRDFYHTVPHHYPVHSGVIVIALRQPNRRSILEKLTWALQQDSMDSIENTIILMRDQVYRIHKQS
ncbi:MAG: DUF5615 family PIN-like protein [Chloroflexota bacterium]